MRITALKAASVTLLLGAGPALASSDEAWKQFAADVETRCLAASKSLVRAEKIAVDPLGTQSYGVAILTGRAVGADEAVSLVCVYDKQSKTAEVSPGFDQDAVTVTIP
ncbi:hypothetical protein ACQQ2Q_02670 [Agrobacterium sp. ES01]|uniref:hypothetical protein n=1 Tax=Agrobacterium sp. ES01 TaxID=3420714 RepID=UPI003D11D05C